MRPALSLLVAACTACGPSGMASPIDGDPIPGLPTCTHPQVVEGILGGTVGADIDTSEGRDGMLPTLADDTNACGAIESRPPQAVLAYRVPGTPGLPVAVTVSLQNPETDRSFDTVLIIRRGLCDGAWYLIDQSCFDDDPVNSNERRSTGSLLAQGGQTLFVIVTGYPSTGFVDRGIAHVEFTARENHPPTIESASVLVTPTGVLVTVAGGDPDADAQSVDITFHGAAQEVLDVDGDLDGDTDDYLFGRFDRSVRGALRFRETATFGVGAGAIDRATEAWLRTVDSVGVESIEHVEVPVLTGVVVGNGEACDASRVCSRELECRDLTCQPTSERSVACTAATTIEVPVPTVTSTSASASGVLSEGVGLFTGDCASTVGREALYRVAVPAGAFDLIATTDTPGTETDMDTVLYARASCADPSTAIIGGCHDDIDGVDNRRSRLELRDVGGTTPTLFVEHFGGVPPDRTRRYEIEVTLRPVLAPGASCDPTEVMNRCAAGACIPGTRVCP